MKRASSMSKRRRNLRVGEETDGRNMGPNDAVVSGFAYAYAATALTILDPSASPGLGITAEMVCTLDNFIRVVLFSERIMITPMIQSPNKLVFPDAEGSDRFRAAFRDADCFSFLRVDSEKEREALQILQKVLGREEVEGQPWIQFVFEPNPNETVYQEMLIPDFIFIETAILQVGLQRYKPLFPGERLYLGHRSANLSSTGARLDFTDLAASRIRATIAHLADELNKLRPFGGSTLPSYPPVFLARLLYDCAGGMSPIKQLLAMRESPGMRRFRAWAATAMQQAVSKDWKVRKRALATFKKLSRFPANDMSFEDFALGVLNIASGAIQGDVLRILTEVVKPVFAVFGGWSTSALRTFAGLQAAPQHLDLFLIERFGDRFRPTEYLIIDRLLGLPETLEGWTKSSSKPTFRPGRLDENQGKLSRPIFIATEDAEIALMMDAWTKEQYEGLDKKQT